MLIGINGRRTSASSYSGAQTTLGDSRIGHSHECPELEERDRDRPCPNESQPSVGPANQGDVT